jgi:hypothetical protein
MIKTSATALLVCLVLGPNPLPAQQPVGGAAALRAGHYLDYFVHWQRDAEHAREAVSGVGGRLMWQLPRAGSAPPSPLSRAALGAYLIRIVPESDRDDVWHLGAQADIPLVRAPLARRVEPVVSLGVGALRAPAEHAQQGGAAPAAEARVEADHALTVTPGIGARVRVMPGVHLRSDVRQVLQFREGTQRILEASGGLSFQV